MWNWIVSNADYTEQYHQRFAEFLESVDTEQIINDTYALIAEYVEKDPTAFYSVEEFELGVQTLRQFCKLRSESIAAQLENGETAEAQNYVDASALTLSDMGSMGGGMTGAPKGNGSAEESSAKEETNRAGSAMASTVTAKAVGAANIVLTAQGMGNNMPNMSFGDMPNGEFDQTAPPDLPDGFDASTFPNGEEGGFAGPMPDNSEGSALPEDTDSESENNNMELPSGEQRPSGDFVPTEKDAGSTASETTAWAWIAVSAVVLAAGLLIAKQYNA